MIGTIQSTMIRASAGSGKTWQLANRFLALMVLGVEPEKIIALTFTKKAAGEFTGRIMTRLADGAAAEDGAAALSKELTKIIHGDDEIPGLVTGDAVDLPQMDVAFFQRKLEELISSLDRLALSTLDSYFVRIVRNFALELGLCGFDLMEDAAISAERLSVMASIFSNQNTTTADREAFLQSFKQATWGEEENRLCQTLEDFVKKHQNRWLSAPDEDRWGSKDKLWGGANPYPETSESLKQKADKVRKLLGEPASPYKTYMNGWVKLCGILENHIPGNPVASNAQLKRAIPLWAEYSNGGLVEEKNKFEISPPLGAAMTDLLGLFISQEIEVRQKRTQGLYSVIDSFEQSYHKQVRSRGRLCFSDLTLLLAGAGAMKMWSDDARDLIDYRLDARYDHWMLDEFQDTSQPQWKAVGNLIDEIMQDAEGQRSVFVVGDSKQSIYGWRGGEPRLFDDLQEHYHQRLAEWEMDRSYRSSQHVLDLVNTVCDLSDIKWRDVFSPAAVDRWVFHAHEPDKEKQGHALVLETNIDPKLNKEGKTEARYNCMKSLISRVDPLAKGLTCAILVNKNSEVTAVVEYLRTELPDIPVASESETKVSDGPIGAAFLDLFRWLANPSHDFGKVHIEMSPLNQIIIRLTNTEESADQWKWLTDQVARHGVEPLVNTIVSELRSLDGLDISDYGESRLDAVHAASIAFSAKGGSISDWVHLLEARSLRETTREGMIQVMTVHKCKGLGFDVVILPELGNHNKFTDSSRLDALERKGELGAVEYILKKPTSEICAADPAVSEMLEVWEADQCYESFCKLYVALTRAVNATYCIIDPVKDSWECSQRYDDWIRESTSRDGESEIVLDQENYTVLYESGQWLEFQDKEDEQPIAEKVINLQQAIPRMGRKVASIADDYQPGLLLEQGSGEGARFGTEVHELFEKVTWLDESQDVGSRPASQLVSDCLAVDSISQHFTRPSLPETDYKLLCEQPFETQQEGRWISGVMDRAVIIYENGKPSEVKIIDYKTDASDDGMTSSSLREKYTEQLEIYRLAMAQITGLEVKRISCFILSTSLKEIVEV